MTRLAVIVLLLAQTPTPTPTLQWTAPSSMAVKLPPLRMIAMLPPGSMYAFDAFDPPCIIVVALDQKRAWLVDRRDGSLVEQAEWHSDPKWPEWCRKPKEKP